MALAKMEFRPGISKDDSPLSAEGGWVDGDKIRFRQGKPQVLGGWEKLTSTAFEGICRGLHVWVALDGQFRIGVGTHTKLYVYSGGGLYDITPVGLVAGNESSGGGLGYGTGGYGEGVYGGASVAEFRPRTWSLANWGENLVANPRRAGVYEWAGNTASPAAIIATAPAEVGSIFVTSERILVACGATEYGGVNYDPMLVHWSDQEDNTNWTPSATNQAGFYSLSHGGRIVRGLPSRKTNLIWTDAALFSMTYLGDPLLVYGFELLGQGCGLIGANAAAEKDGSAYWLSNNGEFYQFTGGAAQQISCPVKRYVMDTLNYTQAEKIYATLNGANNEVWWFYPDTRDGDGDECSRYVTYNYVENLWAVGTWNRTAWVDAGVLQYPLSASADGYLYYQETGSSGDGGAITAYAESAPLDLADGEQLLSVMRAVPDVEDMVGGMTLSLLARMWPAGTETTHGPYTILPSTTKVDIRMTARQVAIRLDSSSAPSFWRLGAMKLDLRETGSKR
jgi:hypothetical protein